MKRILYNQLRSEVCVFFNTLFSCTPQQPTIVVSKWLESFPIVCAHHPLPLNQPPTQFPVMGDCHLILKPQGQS